MSFFKSCIVIVLILTLQSCSILRLTIYNVSDITDYRIFPSRKISASDNVFYFPRKNETVIPDSVSIKKQSKRNKESFENFLERNKTVAFIVIHNDSIEFEKYFNGYSEKSIVASFSMAKSIMGILIGCAIDDGLINSVDDSVVCYLPDLDENEFKGVTIRDLLNMTSGIKFSENYFNPLSNAAGFYYGKGIRKKISRLKVDKKPGQTFNYNSGNSQLLGLLLEKVLSGRSVSEYLHEKIWNPLGMEYDATWSIDSNYNGIEKTFCCVNARAIDFAKIGSLYLKKGFWRGKPVISENWVNSSTRIDTTSNGKWFYHNQWWIHSKNGDFGAEGHNGQFIYVNPQKNLVIVRLGKRYGKIQNWYPIFTQISKKYKY